MNGVAGLQGEGRDLDVKSFASGTSHLVGTPHYAGGCFKGAPGGVLEGLAWGKDRLLANYARAFYFFDMLYSIGDNPVAADELNGVAALVCNADRVLENPFALQRPGVFGRMTRQNLDADEVGDGVGHRSVLRA